MTNTDRAAFTAGDPLDQGVIDGQQRFTPAIAKWLDHGTTDCLRDDGVRDYATEDLIGIPSVSLVRSEAELKGLKTQIEDEVRELYDAGDGLLFAPSFTWERTDVFRWDLTMTKAGEKPEEVAVLLLQEVT